MQQVCMQPCVMNSFLSDLILLSFLPLYFYYQNYTCYLECTPQYSTWTHISILVIKTVLHSIPLYVLSFSSYLQHEAYCLFHHASPYLSSVVYIEIGKGMCTPGGICQGYMRVRVRVRFLLTFIYPYPREGYKGY